MDVASIPVTSPPIVVPETTDQMYPEDKPMFYIGHHEADRPLPDADYAVQEAQDTGYDFITAPITTPHFHSRVLALLSSEMPKQKSASIDSKSSLGHLPIIPPFESKDTQLTPGESAGQLVAYCSAWIDICSADPLIANISRQVLTMEIGYAAFCGISNLVIPGPRLHDNGRNATDGLTRYARAIQEALDINCYVQVAIQIPMYDGAVSQMNIDVGDLAKFTREEYLAESEVKEVQNDEYGTWDSWNVIRSVCKYNSRLSVALEIPKEVPSYALQSRWFAEPLRTLNFVSGTFSKNAGGHPALSRPHQAMVNRFMKLKRAPWLLLCGIGPVSPTHMAPTPAEATQISHSPPPHLTYLRYLQRKQDPRTMIEHFSQGYQDYLQAPLQPLTDNLESATYEVFEKDPVKYDQYELAIIEALTDWKELKKPTSKEGKVVVAVAGAGRGPLVTRALLASKKTGVAIEMWAVEKNPNAYVLLKVHNETDWNGAVTIVKSDMRAWKGPTKDSSSSVLEYGKVDILISELLGSFGDNELSPECLDGVQDVLAPTHGISIPSSYTAHCSPILAPRIHAEISRRTLTDPTALSTPYVVLLHQIDYCATSAPGHPRFQEAWEFVHPVPEEIMSTANQRRQGGVSGGGGGSMVGGDGANEHNIRYARMKFVSKDRTTIHGLAGYFEAVLYKGSNGQSVELSTRPDTIDVKSKDMMSWFPIYFPLKDPLYAPDDSELEVSFWRQTDDRKVWYEWMVEVFVMVGPNRRMRVGMSEVGSSRKNGCLM